jgi:hypothetical protein
VLGVGPLGDGREERPGQVGVDCPARGGGLIVVDSKSRAGRRSIGAATADRMAGWPPSGPDKERENAAFAAAAGRQVNGYRNLLLGMNGHVNGERAVRARRDRHRHAGRAEHKLDHDKVDQFLNVVVALLAELGDDQGIGHGSHVGENTAEGNRDSPVGTVAHYGGTPLVKSPSNVMNTA